jgi:hypothetical protein
MDWIVQSASSGLDLRRPYPEGEINPTGCKPTERMVEEGKTKRKGRARRTEIRVAEAESLREAEGKI